MAEESFPILIRDSVPLRTDEVFFTLKRNGIPENVTVTPMVLYVRDSATWVTSNCQYGLVENTEQPTDDDCMAIDDSMTRLLARHAAFARRWGRHDPVFAVKAEQDDAFRINLLQCDRGVYMFYVRVTVTGQPADQREVTGSIAYSYMFQHDAEGTPTRSNAELMALKTGHIHLGSLWKEYDSESGPGAWNMHLTQRDHPSVDTKTFIEKTVIQTQLGNSAAINLYNLKTERAVEANASVGATSSHITVGLGWRYEVTQVDFDLLAISINQEKELHEFVSHARRSSADTSVRHSGDARCGQSPFSYGAGNGDDEQMYVDLTKISPDVSRIVFLARHGPNVMPNGPGPLGHLSCRVLMGPPGAIGAENECMRFKHLFTHERAYFGICQLVEDRRDGKRGWNVEPIAGMCDSTPQQGFKAVREVTFNPPANPDEQGMYFNREKTIWQFPRNYVYRLPAPPPEWRAPVNPPVVDVETCDYFYMMVYCCSKVLIADSNGFSDPYLSVHLAGKKTPEWRSQVIKKSLTPAWDDMCVLQGPFKADDVIEIEVLDKDIIGSDFLGTVRIPVSEVQHMAIGVPSTLPLRGRTKSGEAAIGFLVCVPSWDMDNSYKWTP